MSTFPQIPLWLAASWTDEKNGRAVVLNLSS
jgi:hypothetical protein